MTRPSEDVELGDLDIEGISQFLREHGDEDGDNDRDDEGLLKQQQQHHHVDDAQGQVGDQPRLIRSTTFLNGLRGLAAFLVYMSHLVPWWYGSGGGIENGFGYEGKYYFAALPFIRSLWSGGSAGVVIFFVLSGYVLSIAPLRALREGKRAEVYARLMSATARRPFRLYIPPVVVSLGFALVMQLPFGLAPRMGWPVPKGSLFAELRNWFVELCVVLNPLGRHGVQENWFPYDPVVWTMPIELKGSFLVFLLVAIFSVLAPRWRVGLLAAAGIVLFFTYQWSMACFTAGMALAMNDVEGFDSTIRRRLPHRGTTITFQAVFFTGWWLLCQPSALNKPELSLNTPGWHYMTMLIPSNYYNNEYQRFWHTIGAALLVYAVLNLSWLQTFFLTPPLRFLGRVSFSLYLTHTLLAWTIGDSICRLFGVVRHEFTTWYDKKLAIPDIGPLGLSTGFILAQMFILPMSLFVADWGTRLIDEPSVKVGYWVSTRLGLERYKQRQQSVLTPSHG